MRPYAALALATVFGLVAALPTAVINEVTVKRGEAETGIYNYYAVPRRAKKVERGESDTGIYDYCKFGARSEDQIPANPSGGIDAVLQGRDGEAR